MEGKKVRPPCFSLFVFFKKKAKKIRKKGKNEVIELSKFVNLS